MRLNQFHLKANTMFTSSPQAVEALLVKIKWVKNYKFHTKSISDLQIGNILFGIKFILPSLSLMLKYCIC